jgi:uncharacterized protein (TIGR03086 family)
VDGRARAAAAGGAANVMIYNPQHRGAKGSVATNGGRGIGTPWPLSGFLERYPMEFLVHTWDLAQATHQSAALDPDLVRDALEPARQFAPMARRFGLIGPECAVAEGADDLTRLLAILGRHKSAIRTVSSSAITKTSQSVRRV